jgi:hypothetical protein
MSSATLVAVLRRGSGDSRNKVVRALALLCALLARRRSRAADESITTARASSKSSPHPRAGGYEIATTILRPDGNGPYGVVV